MSSRKAKPAAAVTNRITIDLGRRQKNVEEATTAWRTAREQKEAADRAYESATEDRDTAIILFNQDVAALKSSCGVSDHE